MPQLFREGELDKVFGNCRPLTYLTVILEEFIIYFWVNTALQKPDSRVSIRSAAACPPRLSPGESSPAYQCSEAEQLQCVLSCLNVDAASEPGILIARGEKTGVFRTWFLRSSYLFTLGLDTFLRDARISPQGNVVQLLHIAELALHTAE